MSTAYIAIPERWEQYIKTRAGMPHAETWEAISTLQLELAKQAGTIRKRLEAEIGEIAHIEVVGYYHSPVLSLIMDTYTPFVLGGCLRLTTLDGSVGRYMSDSVDFMADVPLEEVRDFHFTARPKHIYYKGKVYPLREGSREVIALHTAPIELSAFADPPQYTETRIRVKKMGGMFSSEFLDYSIGDLAFKQIANRIREYIKSGQAQEVLSHG